MTQTKRAASRKRGGSSAAKAEKNGVPANFKFRGVDLKTPKKLPDTLAWDVGEIQSRANDDDPRVLGTLHRMLEELLGREEFQKVRPTVKGFDDPWQMDLLNKVLEAHRLDAGEA